MRADLLADKVVLVSGGTQGLGRQIALSIAAEGASVVVTGRQRDLGEAVVQDIVDAGGTASFVRTDVSDVEQAIGSVTSTVQAYGRIDGVVNCAAATSRGTITDTSPELLDQHYAVNLRAPFFIMQAAVKAMAEQGAGGSIVNIISMAAHGGQPYLAPYVASKAGLVGLTRNVAHAHRWDRIRVNGLNIGWTETEGEDAVQRRFHDADDTWLEAANASVPMGKLGQPDEIADFVVFLLSDRSGVVTGSIIDWDQIVPGAFD